MTESYAILILIFIDAVSSTEGVNGTEAYSSIYYCNLKITNESYSLVSPCKYIVLHLRALRS